MNPPLATGEAATGAVASNELSAMNKKRFMLVKITLHSH